MSLLNLKSPELNAIREREWQGRATRRRCKEMGSGETYADGIIGFLHWVDDGVTDLDEEIYVFPQSTDYEQFCP